MSKSLEQIQKEIGDWSQIQFGNNPSKDDRFFKKCSVCLGAGHQREAGKTAWDAKVVTCGQCHGVGFVSAEYRSLFSLLGVVEEVGELVAPILKRHQGRGFMDYHKEYLPAVRDAVADLMVFLCDFSYRENIDLQETLNLVWEKVSKRRQKTWQDDKDKEAPDNSDLLMVEEEAETPKSLEQVLDKVSERVMRKEYMGAPKADVPFTPVKEEMQAVMDEDEIVYDTSEKTTPKLVMKSLELVLDESGHKLYKVPFESYKSKRKLVAEHYHSVLSSLDDIFDTGETGNAIHNLLCGYANAVGRTHGRDNMDLQIEFCLKFEELMAALSGLMEIE